MSGPSASSVGSGAPDPIAGPAGWRWEKPGPVADGVIRALQESLGLPAAMCEVLARRGYGDPAAARRFLRPRLTHLHPPAELPDLSLAADRLERAVEAGEVVLIHGDYDVDGLTSTALLVRALTSLGGVAHGFVPHRTKDGYDLGEAGLRRAEEVRADLIVTADCGTTAIDAVAQAVRRGIDVIVTDHHRPGPRDPPAVAFVNPSRRGSEYPFDGLAGVGVAFKLASELLARRGFSEEQLNQHLDLVALGTVADQAPLIDENRILVRLGLRALERSRKPGLQALLWSSDLVRADRLRSADLSFRLGPRLNSVGRIGAAEDGLRLLLTDDRETAIRLSRRLEAENKRRQAADRALLADAESRLGDRFDPDRHHAVVLWSDDWHPGLIGIAASRVVERLHRPTLLIAFDGDVGRGSARSIPGFNVYRALESCASELQRFGGHAMAAGLTIRRERLDRFVERFERYAKETLDRASLIPKLRIDVELSLARADRELAGRLEHLGPFGIGNPRPRIAVRDVVFETASSVGEGGRHLRFRLAAPDGSRLDGIGFGHGERRAAVVGGGAWDVVFQLREDTWRGRRRAQAHLVDLRPAGP